VEALHTQEALVEQRKQEALVGQEVLEVYMFEALVEELVPLGVPQGLKYQSQPVESKC
jgi:hypothetical protein